MSTAVWSTTPVGPLYRSISAALDNTVAGVRVRLAEDEDHDHSIVSRAELRGTGSGAPQVIRNNFIGRA
ncbi:hypothetical protein ACFWNN_43190 [Lentzea sp. NPDC058450]|uniref:hypothetical protein n=1 Tax=Lentzea sp. NPDC058450 TaxID=3346505 RepID=UPI003658BADD